MRSRSFVSPSRVLVGTLAILAAACSGANTGSVSLSLSSRRPPGAFPAAAIAGSATSPAVVTAGDSTVITLGNDTIIVRSVEVVLRKIELKRLDATACDTVSDNGDCEEFEAGPALATFPLGATNAAAVVSVNAPAGQYDKLEFEIHKTDTTSAKDAALLAAHPEFKNISIRVTGTYSQAGTRSDFTFASSLDASEEIEFNPPLTVSDGGGTNLTVRLDVATWFLNAGHTALVDPASANKGGGNESIVSDNIKNSIEAFRDDNHDGHDDDHEGS